MSDHRTNHPTGEPLGEPVYCVDCGERLRVNPGTDHPYWETSDGITECRDDEGDWYPHTSTTVNPAGLSMADFARLRTEADAKAIADAKAARR